MSNDNRKSPFSDVDEGDEEAWDKALNAWEMPDPSAPAKPVAPKPKEEPPPQKVAKPPAPPPPPRPLPPPVPPAKRAPIEPPRPGIPTPTAPPPSSRFDEVPKSFEGIDDDEEDATVVARISPELLADAGAQDTGERTSGLGQVLRRAGGKTPATASDGNDALLEMLFEEPTTARRTRDASVVTSAREVELDDRGSIPDDERKKPPPELIEEEPEGVLLDPFSPARPDRPGETLRPGAHEEVPSSNLPGPPVPTINRSVPGRLAPPPPPRVQRPAPPPEPDDPEDLRETARHAPDAF